MILFNFKSGKLGIILGVGMGLCFVQWGFAQTKSSYEDRLSQIAGKAADQNLGTMSGRDKAKQRKKELFDAYTYVPRAEGAQSAAIKPDASLLKDENLLKKNEAATDSAKDETFSKDYVEFRNDHKVPNYIGDDVAKAALKKTKDDTMKTEVVKIVEAEKLLHDTFKAYHQEKSKTELESGLLQTMGNKKETGLDKQKKELDERIDIIGDKTASILNTSIQKLSSSNLIEGKDTQREVYMASGGRVFPKLSLDEDKDFLNVRSKVMDRVQKDLMTALATAINEFYHVEQKETAKAEIEKKEQLLAFVRVEDKAQSREENKIERIHAIQEFITKIERNPSYFRGASGEGSKTLTPERINELKQQLSQLLGTLSAEDRAIFQHQADTNRTRLGDPTGIVNGAPCYEANCNEMGGSGLGQSQAMRSGRAGQFDQSYSSSGSHPVPQKGSSFYESFQQQANINKANGMGDPNGMVNGAPCYDGCGGGGGATTTNQYNQSMGQAMNSTSPYSATGSNNFSPTFEQQAEVNRANGMGEPKGMVNGAPCYDACP